MKLYSFLERKNTDKLSNGRVAVYFNETSHEETITSEKSGKQTSETHTVYLYERAVVSTPLDKGRIVDAIIRSRYSQADVEAIFRHKLAGDKSGEFKEFNDFAEGAKARAVEVLKNI